MPMTQPLKADGQIYRLAKDGQVHLVASGFVNPSSLTFIDDHTFWVSDINGDFIAGRRELPDGFVVSAKASRGLTQYRKLNDPLPWVERMEGGIARVALTLELPPGSELPLLS